MKTSWVEIVRPKQIILKNIWSEITYFFWKGFRMSIEVNSQPVDAVINPDIEEVIERITDKIEKKPAPWASSWYACNPNYLQSSHMTKEERFPLIFDSAKNLKPDAKRILSFGCSTGEEVQALAKRFSDVEIVGVDIDHYSIQTARRRNKLPNVFFHDELGATGKYDLVMALMVFFCMEEAIPKDRFVKTLQKLDPHINDGGVLMIYTSDYDPQEVLGNNYEPLKVWMREHNKNKKQYYNGYYRKKGGSIVYEQKLEIDPTTIPDND